MPDGIWHRLIVCLGACFITVKTGCNQPAQRLSLQLLESKVISGITEQRLQLMVISNQKDFQSLYNTLHAAAFQKPPLPKVDFTMRRVLVALMGQQPTAGYAIQFGKHASRDAETIEVHVRLRSPPRGMSLAQVITSPYALAVISKNGYQRVKFSNEDGKILDVIDIH